MQEESKMITPQESYNAILTNKDSFELNINISKETFELLEVIAKKKDLSVISIIKFFIGKGIRDLEPELANKSAVERLRNRKKLKEEKVEVDLVA